MDEQTRQRLIEKAAQAAWAAEREHTRETGAGIGMTTEGWERLAAAVVDALQIERWGTYVDACVNGPDATPWTGVDLPTSETNGTVAVFRVRAAEDTPEVGR